MSKEEIKEVDVPTMTDAPEGTRIDDEMAREVNRRVNEALALERAGKVVRLPVAGSVELTLTTGDGKKEKAKWGFKDGAPTVRVNGNVVSSEGLLALANGKLADEDKAKWPYLGALNQAKALEVLTLWASKGSGLMQKLGMLLLLMVCFSVFAPTVADAQIRQGRFQYFPDSSDPAETDTLSTTDTVIYTFTKTIWDLEKYDYDWVFEATRLSDTTELTIYIQESFYETGDSWFPTDTVEITRTTSGTTIEVAGGTVTGIRQRAWVRSTDGSTRFRAGVRYRRKTSW